MWHEAYQPQDLILAHHVTELARSSLLADQMAEFRQAQLTEQARREELRWRRGRQRRTRYLGIQIRTRPAEAVEQLLAFGAGVEFLVDAFLGLIREVRTLGHLSAEVAVRDLEVCGCTQEPAAIGCNPLAYTILINNLGATPGVSAADIDPWLGPLRRPGELRDRPRHELMGANPEECGIRLLGILEAECKRLQSLADRVHEEVDIPSLCQALNRVCILTDKEARRAARAHTEARGNFRQAVNDLTKALDREQKKRSGPLSSVNGHSRAGNGAATEEPAKAARAEEAGAMEAGFESQGAGTADREKGRTEAPLHAGRREDGLFPPKPENTSDRILPDHYQPMTYVDARVSSLGCAKMRKTEAQPDSTAAHT
jgi:hypothetical protein